MAGGATRIPGTTPAATGVTKAATETRVGPGASSRTTLAPGTIRAMQVVP